MPRHQTFPHYRSGGVRDILLIVTMTPECSSLKLKNRWGESVQIVKRQLSFLLPFKISKESRNFKGDPSCTLTCAAWVGDIHRIVKRQIHDRHRMFPRDGKPPRGERQTAFRLKAGNCSSLNFKNWCRWRLWPPPAWDSRRLVQRTGGNSSQRTISWRALTCTPPLIRQALTRINA